MASRPPGSRRPVRKAGISASTGAAGLGLKVERAAQAVVQVVAKRGGSDTQGESHDQRGNNVDQVFRAGRRGGIDAGVTRTAVGVMPDAADVAELVPRAAVGREDR